MFFRKKKIQRAIPAPATLSLEEKQQVYEYAKNKHPSISGRQRIVDIHRDRIRKDPRSCRSSSYMSFLAEVDNPCPDLVLRARYREEVIKDFEEKNGS